LPTFTLQRETEREREERCQWRERVLGDLQTDDVPVALEEQTLDDAWPL
jgi:hypothetical protein